MKLYLRIIPLFVLLTVLASCSTNSSKKDTFDRSSNEPTLIAYEYKVKDIGDGWNLGTLKLAFENTKDYFVPDRKGRDSWGYSVGDAYVETKEGKTYSIRVYNNYSKFSKADGSADKRENYISLDMPKIPPGFRIFMWRTETEYAGGNYILEFRFAKAAHPTTIVFPNKPEWNISLSKVPANLQMPVASSSAMIKSIASLKGKVLLDPKGKLLVTIGDCNQSNIYIVAQNRDSLDSASETIYFPAVAYFYTGDDIRDIGGYGIQKA